MVLEPIVLDYTAAALAMTGGSITVGPDFTVGLPTNNLKLNRILRAFPIAKPDGKATDDFQLKYQRNCESTEQAFEYLAGQVSFLQTVVAGLQQAQQDAATANQGVAALSTGVSLSSSRTEPVDGLLTATSDGVVVISAHNRVYTTGTTETSVPVDAGSISGFAQGAFVRVYYADAAREGGAVAYQGTTDEVTQTGDIHVIGGVAIPTAGNPPSSGTGTTPPGYVREQTIGEGGAAP